MKNNELVESKKCSESNERQILRACLLGEEAFLKITEKINENHFFKRQNREIFNIIIEFVSNNKKPIPTNIEPKLAYDLQALETFRDIKYLKVDYENIDTIINILIDRKNWRDLYSVKQWLTLRLDSNEIPEIIFNQLNKKLLDFGQDIESNDDHINNIVQEYIPDPDNLQESKDEIIGIPSGINRLDKMTLGWEIGDLIYIAGRPGTGKTSYSFQCAIHAARLNYPVLIYSLETTKKKVVDRLLSHVCEIDNYQIRTRRIRKKNDKEKFIKGYKELRDLPIVIDDSVSHTPLSIFNSARSNRMKYGDIGLVIVDYIQLMGTDHDQLKEITRQFQNYAKTLNTSIILISQFHRGYEYRDTNWREPPKQSDLRASGSLEESGFKILAITSEPNKELKTGEQKNIKRSIIWVLKNKDGETGPVPVLNYLNTYTFKEANFSFEQLNQEQQKDTIANNFYEGE